MRLNRTSLLAGVAFAALAAGVVPGGPRGGPIRFGFGPAVAQAQNLGQRVVSGYVVDTNSKPVGGATVFLRDLKTKSIRSYTSAADGKFRFTQVDMAEDHELWAEKDGKKSATKTVSSWDTRTDFVCELKLK
ncbi:MAG: carboxypeptidase-like regulatory domain-containing protein [Terracidiphilus sp.]